MRRRISGLLFWVGSLVVVLIIGVALVRAAPRKRQPVAPDLPRSPARVYGTVEPLGGAVLASAPVTRRVTAVYVKEGDRVYDGQELVELERSVERAQLRAAQARAAAAEQSYQISREAFERTAALYAVQGVSEQQYREALLRQAADSAALAAAKAEVSLAVARWAQLTLDAPADGIVYKLDVRLGQTLVAGDDSKVTLGSARQQVRLFVESFWRDRVRIGDEYELFDAETGSGLGRGRVIAVSPFLGGRSLQTDDPAERFDAEYQIVTVELDTSGLPIGLAVVANLPPR